jgi:hypothetical protein
MIDENLFKDDNKKKIITPIKFVEDGNYVKEAISYIEKNINSETKFAILKTTQNGKFVRGDSLYYSLNGVSIYTELDNIIFVDLDNNNLFIKASKKLIDGINPSKPEEREYIILYTDLGYEDPDDEFPMRWEAIIGRNNTYETIKANVDVIDIDKSIVLTENVTLKDSLTVREFMNHMKNSGIIKDDDFDINDYAGSEYI